MTKIANQNRQPYIKRAATTTVRLHVAKAALKWTDEIYRDWLFDQFGVRSSKDMTESQRVIAVKKLDDLQKAVGVRRRQAAPSELDPMTGKMYALWCLLGDAGVVRNRSYSAMAAYFTRVTKIDSIEWATASSLNVAIESLKNWCGRAGVAYTDSD